MQNLALVEVFAKKFQSGTSEKLEYLEQFVFFDGLDKTSTNEIVPYKNIPGFRHFYQTAVGFKFRAIGEESSENFGSDVEFELTSIGGLEFFDSKKAWLLKEADRGFRVSQTGTARFVVLVDTKTEFDSYLKEYAISIESMQRLDLDELLAG